MDPAFKQNFYLGMGASHVYKTGTAHSTAAEVLAAVTGKSYRLKAFRCTLADANTDATALNNAWLAHGTTPFLALTATPLQDLAANIVDHRIIDTGMITLPSYGVTGASGAAINIDFTAVDALLSYQLDLWYDIV